MIAACSYLLDGLRYARDLALKDLGSGWKNESYFIKTWFLGKGTVIYSRLEIVQAVHLLNNVYSFFFFRKQTSDSVLE